MLYIPSIHISRLLFLEYLAQNKYSMSSNKPTSCGDTLNFIQIDNCMKMDTEVFDFLYNCDLDEGQGHQTDIKM